MLIFGAGVVTGGLLVRYSEGMNPPPSRNPNSVHSNLPLPALSPNQVRIEFLRRMERDLNLTPEQKKRIDGILAASQERTRTMMEPVAPQVREELQKARELFRAELTPVQAERFDTMIKQQQRPREQRHPGGHPQEGTGIQSPPAGDPAKKP